MGQVRTVRYLTSPHLPSANSLSVVRSLLPPPVLEIPRYIRYLRYLGIPKKVSVYNLRQGDLTQETNTIEKRTARLP